MKYFFTYNAEWMFAKNKISLKIYEINIKNTLAY